MRKTREFCFSVDSFIAFLGCYDEASENIKCQLPRMKSRLLHMLFLLYNFFPKKYSWEKNFDSNCRHTVIYQFWIQNFRLVKIPLESARAAATAAESAQGKFGVGGRSGGRSRNPGPRLRLRKTENNPQAADEKR